MINNVGYNSSVKWIANNFWEAPVVPINVCVMVTDLWQRDLETVKADITESILRIRKEMLTIKIACTENISRRRAALRAETEFLQEVSFGEIIDAESILDGTLTFTPMKVTREMVDVVLDLLGARCDALKAIPKWCDSPQHLQWLEEADNFLQFLNNNCSPSLCGYAAHRAIAQMKMPFVVTKMKNFKEFASEAVKAILNPEQA